MQSIILRRKAGLKALFLGMALSALPAHALQSDRNQPVNIESVEQTADLQANRLVFAGDVVATQGTIRITADKIEVSRNKNGTLESVTAYGTPVTFQQQQDNGTIIRSRSSILKYLPASTRIVLQGRVTIWQGESKITGERIEYNVTTQKMHASNNNSQGGRVSSTFVPSDFSSAKSDKK